MLTNFQKTEFAQLLRRRERVLRAEVRVALRERLGRDLPALDAGSEDRADQSVADLLDGIDTSSLTRDVDELLAIEAALDRLALGSYGTCIDCGTEIDYPRLLALPFAARCLACQDRYERQHGRAQTSQY